MVMTLVFSLAGRLWRVPTSVATVVVFATGVCFCSGPAGQRERESCPFVSLRRGVNGRNTSSLRENRKCRELFKEQFLSFPVIGNVRGVYRSLARSGLTRQTLVGTDSGMKRLFFHNVFLGGKKMTGFFVLRRICDLHVK